MPGFFLFPSTLSQSTEWPYRIGYDRDSYLSLLFPAPTTKNPEPASPDNEANNSWVDRRFNALFLPLCSRSIEKELHISLQSQHGQPMSLRQPVRSDDDLALANSLALSLPNSLALSLLLSSRFLCFECWVSTFGWFILQSLDTFLKRLVIYKLNVNWPN